MAAHCRLRQLHHVAELGDLQLASFQHREHTHTNRIGEDRKLIDNWRRTIHPYIRMKGYIMRQAYVKRAFQGAVFASAVPCIKGEAARLATKIHRNARDDVRFMLWTLCTQPSFKRS